MKKFYEKFCKFEENLALVLLAGLTILVFVSAMIKALMILSRVVMLFHLAFMWHHL